MADWGDSIEDWTAVLPLLVSQSCFRIHVFFLVGLESERGREYQKEYEKDYSYDYSKRRINFC